MEIELPEGVRRIITRLSEHGHEAYAVGGCVRDSLLGRAAHDWDITTSATPQEVKACFRRTIDTGIQHGTVTVMLGKEGYEVTTYRLDGVYEDARHPKEVTFTDSLTEDLKRRDFTINAMAYNEDRGLVDAFGGREDLENKVIRCVGNPRERFSEDALRMLRAVRFSAQLGFSIEEDTKEAVRELSPSIARISAERIREELVKLLMSGNPQEIRTVYELGLTSVFLPEFDIMMDTPQNTPHHCYTVGEHTIHAICGVPADPILRITMLLHDVAKPKCRTTDENGRDHFHGHPAEGQKMAEDILRRLKFDNATIARVSRLVRWHDCRPQLADKSVRRAMNRMGEDLFPDIFAVNRADIRAQSDYMRHEKLAAVDSFESIYQEILAKGECFSLKDLAVNGNDLIAAGIKPGMEMGKLLHRLLEHVIENPEDNNKEKLLELALCGGD
ncbi:MAG: CCA tRNA nucleotidyltransferase [Clostridiales bacterium]|nr:CCA tRNA nucleotidyltransferase [Clostridiales bacterium]